ncbi:MAG: NUDIX domain-containing protein [Deltaproteobacteria bacterium]|nr:NUDIX domain-containing protein [Deltaproteobacteria bacterium]
MSYLSQEDYDFVFARTPRACLDFVIHDGMQRILLIRRTTDPEIGAWHLPGGRVRLGESTSQAGERILLQELGINLLQYELIGYMNMPGEKMAGKADQHSISMVFLVTGRSHFVASRSARFFKKAPRKTLAQHRDHLPKFFDKVRAHK